MAVIGTTFLALSMCVFVVGTERDMLIVFCVALVAQGLGNGISRPPVTAALANSVPETDLGMASALQRMTQQIGNSFGIAILTAVYDGSGTAEGFGPPFMIGVGLSIVAVIFASFLREDVIRRPVHPHVEAEDPEFEVDVDVDVDVEYELDSESDAMRHEIDVLESGRRSG
jgi:MFS family permease